MGRSNILFHSNSPRPRNAAHRIIIHVKVFANTPVLWSDLQTLHTKLVIDRPTDSWRRFHLNIFPLGYQSETWFPAIRVTVVAVSATPQILVRFEGDVTSEEHASGSSFANDAHPVTGNENGAVVASG